MAIVKTFVKGEMYVSEWLTARGDQLYGAFVEGDRWKLYFQGLGKTLQIAACAVILGIVIGIVIAIIKVSAAQQREKGKCNAILWLAEKICNLYLTVIRGTPVMVQLLIIYTGIFVTMTDGTLAAVVGFGINSGAYVAEIIRAGIQSIDRGQTEAGRSLGLTSGMTMRLIILPQAIKNILPAIGNEFVTMIKETSIIQYLGVSDLMYNNGIVVSATYNPLPCYYISAIIYLILNLVAGKGVNIFERRLKRSDR